jgi:hypothetical protein
MICTLSSGLDLHKAIEKAHRMGATIEDVRKTGEYRFRHPLMSKPCRVDGRRKDAPRHLCVWLRQLARLRRGA